MLTQEQNNFIQKVWETNRFLYFHAIQWPASGGIVLNRPVAYEERLAETKPGGWADVYEDIYKHVNGEKK